MKKYRFLLLLLIGVFTSCKNTASGDIPTEHSTSVDDALVQRLEGTWVATNYADQVFDIALEEGVVLLDGEKLLVSATTEETIQTVPIDDETFHYDFEFSGETLTIYRWFPDEPGSVGGGGLQPIDLIKQQN